MAEKAAVEEAEDLAPQELDDKEHRRELHLFNKIATITAHTLDLQEISNEVLGAILEFFQIDAGLLLLWDRLRQRLTYAASRGFPQDYLGKLSDGKLEGIVRPNLSRARQPLIIKDISRDSRLFSSSFTDLIRQDPRFRSVVSIPLKYREEVTGFLNLAAATAKPFRAAGRKKYFFSILGNQIGLAIDPPASIMSSGVPSGATGASLRVPRT
jgi:GAF domain-containing protein